MDYSNTEAPASSSIVEPAVREAMPPEWMPPIEEMMPPEYGIFEATTIEEAMPPEYRRAAPREEMPPEYASSTPKELMRPRYWEKPEDIEGGSVRIRRRAVLKFNGIVPPELPTSSKTFELATSDHHWILFRDGIYGAVYEIFKLWVQDTSRKEKIENFDAFWAWVNDQPFRNEYLQKIANIYARYNIQPVPPGIEYVETIEFVTSRQPLNIDRILATLNPKRIPPDLDRHALQNDLLLCLWHYDQAKEARSRRGKDQFAALKEADKLAQQLIAMLKSENVRQHAKSSTCEWHIGQLEELISECKSPIDNLDDEGFQERSVAIRAGLLPRAERYEGWGSVYWLVGDYLPRAFSKHFRDKPGTKPNSPYVRFAESVLREAVILNDEGNFYKRESISRAMKYKRGGHLRQKPRE
jgi:hypothetical protein